MTRLWVFLGVLILVVCGMMALNWVRSRSPMEPGTGDAQIDVVTTTGFVGDLAARIGGERVRVTSLMGPGMDPHLFKASEGDVTRMGQADLILHVGLHLEGRLSDVLNRVADRGVVSVAVTQGIPRERLLFNEGMPDPHVWHDVSLWMEAARTVRDALSRVDPEGASEYTTRYESYLGDLTNLHAWVRQRLGSIPRERRVLVTAHDAFAYFGRAYDVEVRGIQGLSTVAEAGIRDIEAMADFIVQRRIPTVFVEASVSPRVVEALQSAVRARGFEVRIGEPLLSDALGEPGTPEGTYEGMIRHNVEAISRGLGGG